MTDRKSKREPDETLEMEQELGFVLEPAKVELGSGYTVHVSYDQNDKPIISLKTFGEVDLTKVRKEILRAFP